MNPTTTPKHLAPVKLRLSDSAMLAGTVSLLYALALMVWPRAFPEAIERIFDGGRFYPAFAILLVASNEILFVFICMRRGQKPSPLTLGYIAFLTAAFVFLLRELLSFAEVEAHLFYFPAHASAGHWLNSEELLFYTHLGIVAGIVLPYLVVRMTQDYVSGVDSEEPAEKARHAAAGQ